ncbi:MET18 [Acanthosepion pharaonis]|uniref:MMS19 nucleotide excision repair protein n=1 Tax=Acanthosepion pharaonis TaxID=158019 RepID=A0A812D4Y3_ACAPH|nr:MET18 [Sepia pharaonis]
MAASCTWSNLVEEYFSGVNNSAASKIATGLTKKEVSLLAIIRCLGSAFTASDTNRRVEGTALLVDALHQIPQDLLTFAEVELLSSFLSDRLSDHHSLQPLALHGLAALSNCCNIPSLVPERVCRRIFREVQNQSLPQKDRFSVYTIMYNFLTTKLEDLRKMESDFVCGFIQAMDGEKDPRNLRFAFQCAHLIIKNLPLGVFVEEMFEITACYFPIDFQPPPNNPFWCSSLFAPFVLPLLSDKMSSDIQDARIDAMQTLASVSEVYGAEALTKYLSTEIIFSMLKKEYMSGILELQKPSLEALTALISSLSLHVDEGGSYPSLLPFLDCILKACVLDYEYENQFTSHIQLLHSTAAASTPSGCYVLQHILPKILQMYKDAVQTNQKGLILNCFHGFILATRSASITTAEESPVFQHRDEIFTMLLSTFNNTSVLLCKTVVKCLDSLLDYHGVLNNTDKILIVEHIFILVQNKDEMLRSQCITILSNMSSISPDIVKQNVLPQLYQSLKKMETINKNNESCWQSVLTTLEVLSSVCKNPSMTKLVLPEIWAWLENLLRDDINQKSEVTELCHEVLKAIVKIVAYTCESDSVLYLDYLYTWFVPRLLQLTIPHLLDSGISLSAIGIMESGATILRDITTKLDKRKAEVLCEQIICLFLHEDKNAFNIMLASDCKFQPLKCDSPVQQTRLVAFLTAVVCSTLLSVSIYEIDKLLEQLANLAIFTGDEITLIHAAKCCAGLFNKYSQTSPAKECLETLQENLKAKLTNLDKSTEKVQLQTLHLWLWLTKALVMCAHQQANQFVDLILNLFEECELGESAAKGIYLILNEYKDVLSRSQHAKVRLMYRQRFFVEHIQRLSESFHHAKPELKKNYLIAVSHLLTFLPRQVLVSELPPLIPMLVLALMSDECKLQLSTMSTLKTVMDESPALLAQHVNLIVPRLLKLSKTDTSMKVRIASLECLEYLTQLPASTLLPYRREVIRFLEPVLDDKKRLVRRQAVRARGEWYLLGAPIS